VSEPADAPPTLGDEATRLLTALPGWAQEWLSDLVRRARTSESHETGSDCQWCPLCQLLAVLRGERPELTERVVEAGTAALSALRTFVEVAVPAGRDGGAAHDAPADGPPARVQRIDLSGPA
jgi:hypothetical protein